MLAKQTLGTSVSCELLVAKSRITNILTNPAFPEEDADNWWRTVEVNIRGVYNLAQ